MLRCSHLKILPYVQSKSFSLGLTVGPDSILSTYILFLCHVPATQTGDNALISPLGLLCSPEFVQCDSQKHISPASLSLAPSLFPCPSLDPMDAGFGLISLLQLTDAMAFPVPLPPSPRQPSRFDAQLRAFLSYLHPRALAHLCGLNWTPDPAGAPSTGLSKPSSSCRRAALPRSVLSPSFFQPPRDEIWKSLLGLHSLTPYIQGFTSLVSHPFYQ